MATPIMVVKFLNVYVKLFFHNGDIANSLFAQEVRTVNFFGKI